MKGETRNRNIAEPLQNRQHARKTPNAVNTSREGERERQLKGWRERGIREKVDFVQFVDFVNFDI